MPETPFVTFVNNLSRGGMEPLGKFYGIYRATVTRNDDPEERGRIQALCPQVGHDVAPSIWIDPAFDGAGDNNGMFWPPEVGSSCRIAFDCGNPQAPDVYFGGWYGTAERPAELAYSNGRPERRGLVTRIGHYLVMTDEKDAERIRLVWHKPDSSDPALSDPAVTADRTKGKFSVISFNPDGSIQLFNQNGTNINLDATNKSLVLMDQNGNSATLDGEGIKLVDKAGNFITLVGGEVTVVASSKAHIVSPVVNLKGGSVLLGDQATFSAVLGENLLAFLASHTHPSPVGPTGTPMPPPQQSILSTTVKVRK